MANKGYTFYSIADEAPTGDEQRFEITKQVSDEQTKVNYIEWRQRILKFNRYNRNRRRWTAQHARASLLHPWINDYFVHRGGVPGENGHPINTIEGEKLSMERIITIDPDRIVLVLKSYEFEGDQYLWGTFQTLDDGEGGPGDRLRRSIIQGLTPSVSLRSVVPQRKNPDGTIDVMGPGRFVCWDRVLYPSDDEAFATAENPFKLKSRDIQKMATAAKESATLSGYEQAITDYVLSQSEACKYVLDGMEYAAESASVTADSMLATITEDGPVFIPLEDKIKTGIEKFMRNF